MRCLEYMMCDAFGSLDWTNREGPRCSVVPSLERRLTLGQNLECSTPNPRIGARPRDVTYRLLAELGVDFSQQLERIDFHRLTWILLDKGFQERNSVSRICIVGVHLHCFTSD